MMRFCPNCHTERPLSEIFCEGEIGENIIVFDFIRPDVAEEIFTQMVDNTFADLHAQGMDILLTDTARANLRALCLADLSNGGRGIRNQLEVHLLNPLSRALFDADAQPEERWTIESLEAEKLGLRRVGEGGR